MATCRMSALLAVISLAMRPRMPRSSSAVISMRVRNMPLTSSSHSTSIQRSASRLICLRAVSQSMRWMDRPWPPRIWPMMRSPGTGWQQVAACSEMPSMDWMTMGAVCGARAEVTALRPVPPLMSSEMARATTGASFRPRPMSA